MTTSLESEPIWRSGIEDWGAPVAAMESLERRELSPRIFQEEFVDRCRPHIRGAAEHWPAMERWADADYLKTLGGESFPTFSRPVLELKWRHRQWPERFRSSFEAEQSHSIPFEELLELASAQRFVFAYSAVLAASPGLRALAADMIDLDLVELRRHPLYYAPLRLFLHGRSYTDWHYHPQDETLMFQFVRPKRVVLLPPVPTWDVLLDIARHEDHIGSAPASRYPALATLTPRVVVSQPGDACYIPPHWWHAVECTDSTPALGVTAACCWRSPNHVRLDPRFPYRRFIRTTGKLRTRLRFAFDALRWSGYRAGGRALPAIPDDTVRTAGI